MGELFEYAVLRVVPRVERGEFLNAGVVLHCATKGFLDARVHLDLARLSALHPGADGDAMLAHLEATRLVCAGGPRAGYVGLMPKSQRFGWLTAPRSAVIQPSPVHTGFSEDPGEALEHLLRVMVLPPGS